MKRIVAIIIALAITLSGTIALGEIDLSNMTADELQELINHASEQLSVLRRIPANSGEKITLSGSKTKIVSGVHIDFSPCRVTFKQEGNAEYQISYIRGEYDGNLMYEYNGSTSTALLNKNGDYEFAIEATSPWTLEFEPLVEAGALDFSGHGDYVSDIFTISGSTIIDIEGTYSEFDNFIVTVYTLGSYGWSSDGLTNGLQSSGTESYEKIIKASGETKLFFTVDFDNGDWSIKAVGD